MYCPNCGTKVSDNAKFCNNCGTALGERVINGFTQAVSLAKAGEERGFTYLYEETYKSKYYLALKYMDNKEAAEDVVQDAYIKAFSKLDTLKDPETFSSWLGTIVANTAKNALQKKNPTLFSDLPSGDEEADLPDFDVEDESLDAQPEEAYTRQEIAELVQEMIGSLSEEQKMCILMYHIDGESIHDIAEALDCSENTVKSRLNYGRKNLKAKAEDLQKKGYKLFTLAPIPLLLFLLREDADAMTAEQSFLAAGKQMESVILEQAQSLAQGAAELGAETAAQTGTQTAAQAGAKAAAGASSHGFFATTAGKVVIGVIIAGAVAGGVGGGLAVRHNNQVKQAEEEAEKAAEEEARRNELIAEAEAGAAAEAEAAEAAEIEIEEPEEALEEEVEEEEEIEEEEEEVAIPVTNEMYPELLEGGLTKEQLEEVLAYAPVMTNGELSQREMKIFLENITLDCWGRGYSSDRDSRSYSQEIIGVSGGYRDNQDFSVYVDWFYDYNWPEMNNFLSVLVEDPAAMINSYSGEDTDPFISGDTLTIGLESGDGGNKGSTTIKEAEYKGDTMAIFYEVYSYAVTAPDLNSTVTRTAVLKQTDDGRYRIDSIMDGTVDVLSAGDTSSASSGDYILPDSSTRYLTEDELSGLSLDELRKARNEIYARHGRKFDNTELQNYFNGKSWYNGTINPDDFDDDNILNDYEKENIKLIQSLEGDTTQASSNTASTNTGSGFSFANIDNMSFVYSSGAGAWGVVLTIHSDGTFEGVYHDSDSYGRAVNEDGYELYATETSSEWTGKFSTPVKVNDYTYSTKVESITLTKEPGSEIKDHVEYVYTSEEGMSVGDEFTIYLPSTQVTDLPDGFMNSVSNNYRTSGSQLSKYGLLNTTEYAAYIQSS